MTHYVCTGTCGGESDKPGLCQAEGCTKEEQPLEECNCDDGLHKEIITAHTDDFHDEDLQDDQL